MENKNYLDIIRCLKCFGSSFSVSEINGKVKCSCGSIYDYEQGRIFFTDLPKDARRVDDRPDSGRWSRERALTEEYLKKNLLNEDAGKVVCDLGIGTAPFTFIAEKFRVIGVDFFPYKPVQIVADVSRPLPIKDNSCDIVITTEMLEHVPTPHIFMSEIYRILKPGGYVIGSAPFLHATHYHPYDFYRYTRFALERFFKENGFKKYEVVHIGTPADVYKGVQDRFFSAYMMRKSLSGNMLLHKVLYLILRMIRKTQNLLFGIMRPFFGKLDAEDDFVLSYCFKAEK